LRHITVFHYDAHAVQLCIACRSTKWCF